MLQQWCSRECVMGVCMRATCLHSFLCTSVASVAFSLEGVAVRMYVGLHPGCVSSQ
jgi:hypothetical protein